MSISVSVFAFFLVCVAVATIGVVLGVVAGLSRGSAKRAELNKLNDQQAESLRELIGRYGKLKDVDRAMAGEITELKNDLAAMEQDNNDLKQHIRYCEEKELRVELANQKLLEAARQWQQAAVAPKLSAGKPNESDGELLKSWQEDNASRLRAFADSLNQPTDVVSAS